MRPHRGGGRRRGGDRRVLKPGFRPKTLVAPAPVYAPRGRPYTPVAAPWARRNLVREAYQRGLQRGRMQSRQHTVTGPRPGPAVSSRIIRGPGGGRYLHTPFGADAPEGFALVPDLGGAVKAHPFQAAAVATGLLALGTWFGPTLVDAAQDAWSGATW
jgi:hypothetical protein